MKICTITCHDVYNHGASLQAYALMKHLENCGHDVEIIDYKPDYLSNHYNLFSINNPKWEKNIITKLVYLFIKIPLRLPELRRKKSFDQFKERYLKVTSSKYISNEELKKDLPDAEVFFCGSDQIWNSLLKNGRDPAFYLDFVPQEKIKASYAASFATETILDEIKPMVKKKVEKLDRVSVREKSGIEILTKLNINKAVSVVDPVFLLNKEAWEEIGSRQFNEKYILVYDFDNSKLLKRIAIELKEKLKINVYSLNPINLAYADKKFMFDGPETFVSLVKNAEFVISNSFHAAVFSIIFEKNFVITNRTELINTRMRDLLNDLKLSSRLVNDNYELEYLLKKINYTDSKKLLKEKILQSKKYLEDVISLDKSMRYGL